MNITDRIIAWFERPRVWGFFLSAAIMAIVALAFFYPDNFDGNTLQQPDMVQGAANGQEGEIGRASCRERVEDRV